MRVVPLTAEPLTRTCDAAVSVCSTPAQCCDGALDITVPWVDEILFHRFWSLTWESAVRMR